MTFDPTKPVQTRSGHPARIICTDRANAKFPILALILRTDGLEGIESFTSSGEYAIYKGVESPDDLINIPETRKVWVNIYDFHSGDRTYYTSCKTKEQADKMASYVPERIACIPIEFKVGDGL